MRLKLANATIAILKRALASLETWASRERIRRAQKHPWPPCERCGHEFTAHHYGHAPCTEGCQGDCTINGHLPTCAGCRCECYESFASRRVRAAERTRSTP